MPLPLRIAPLPGYVGEFTPWAGKLITGDRKAPDGCVAPSEGALMLAGRGESYTTVGQIVGASRQLVGMWATGDRHPADELQAVMDTRLGIPAIAWQLWRSSSPAPPPAAPLPAPEAKREEPSPTNSPATLPGSSGSVLEKARALLVHLSVPGKTSDDLAQAREIRHALTLEARLAGSMMATSKARLHDHPDWPALQELLVTSLAAVPGALDALEGALIKFAEGTAE